MAALLPSTGFRSTSAAHPSCQSTILVGMSVGESSLSAPLLLRSNFADATNHAIQKTSATKARSKYPHVRLLTGYLPRITQCLNQAARRASAMRYCQFSRKNSATTTPLS
jgi:hypothetical protein